MCKAFNMSDQKAADTFFTDIAQGLIDQYEKETGEIHIPDSPSWLHWLRRSGFMVPEELLNLFRKKDA
tara:strand:+ start:977 stop:1180 length:204 start_codon:yes stop_codon:yes gene_type:complete